MKLRAIKLRTTGRVLYRARIWAPDHFDVSWHPSDWVGDWGDDGRERNAMCEHCDGTGGDPWNDGITPCEHCGGEGYEWWR